jgi:Yip1 domain
MNLIERAKNICLSPKTEWDVISAETTETQKLMLGYVAPLAAIGAVAGFVGNSVIGHSNFLIGTYRMSVGAGLGIAILGFVMAFVAVFVLSLIIDALAPSFGGEKNSAQALKVAVYSYTPAWLAGIFQLIPMLGILAILGALYALYLLYLGLPKLMKCPEDKAIGYTAVVVICAIVLSVVIGILTTCVGGAGMLASGALNSGLDRSSSSSNVVADKNSPLGKLEDFGKKMEAAGKKMEAAEKSGDEAAKMAAATGMLGALLGGGKNVEPIGIDQLKPFVPETMAGLAKKSSKTEKTGVAGLMISKAEATYGDDSGKSIEFDLSDTGGASGLMGMASWMNVQGEKEDQYGSEKTSKVNGRLVNEKVSKSGGSNEISVVVGDRFVVSVKGRGLSIDEVRKAVAGIDLAKLEAMKDVGVTAAK